MKYFYTLIFWFLSAAVSYAAKHTLQCKVVAISDGDTLSCLINKTSLKVRLQHIDAPEQTQPYGTKAKQALANLVFKKNITLKISGYDRYQRMLAVVYDENGKNINLTLIQQGMAWAYNKEAGYQQAQDKAQKAKVGLWQAPNPIVPSEWRKGDIQPTHSQAVKKRENFANISNAINCQTKLSCNQIGNYKMAQHYFHQCGWKELDGNNDGIPCNKLYRQSQQNRN
ncbi:thermonuclease family protein [Mannheimia granulomatis]|uniref:thermonuclease family protein n=1 Tax=Mannheimia granulomatis TaxID=85402 RepID=UPI00047C9611|nr:thermonuclease family protein [Mannheimia granulomatis]QLB19286.1 nuclease [Mannheimia granulomatis]